MAINYSDLFANIGAFVKATNTLEASTNDLETEKNDILSQLNTTNKYTLMEGITSTWNDYKSSVFGWTNDQTSKIFSLLTEQSIATELLLGQNTGFSSIFPLLYADMVTNDKNVTANSVTLGSVTVTATNANVGTALIDKVLDGVTSPGSGFTPYRSYNGLNSQISYNDDVVLRCINDSEMSGISPGQETFAWIGEQVVQAATRNGSGNGPSIVPLNNQSFLSNLSMDSFSTNTLTGFTIDSGTAGTHVFKDDTNQYEGTACLKLTGDGAQSSIQLSQAFSAGILNPLKRYAFVCHIKGQSGTSSGTLTIQLEGTGYTAGASEKISLNAATLAGLTSWTRYSFYVNMPLEIPDDLKLVIKWTGTPSAHSVRVDNGAFGTPTYWNGINVLIHKGSGKFLYGDKITFSVTNSEAGIFQTHARNSLKIQWPTDATPTISDTLAQ